MNKQTSIILKTSIILVALILFVSGANAQSTPKVDQKQTRQKVRIVDGIADNELSKRESVRLIKEQRKINRMERRIKRDGHVSARERVRLNKALRRSNRHIVREKNDNNRR